jgi:Z1 domain/Type III restriction enzyme, res subunit
MSFDDIVAQLEEESNQHSCYPSRLETLETWGRDTSLISNGIADCLRTIESGTRSFVVYGEPQSGKTEFMIALVCKLVDLGKKTVFIIMNDNTELETQNFDRFHHAIELNPTPLRDWEIVKAPLEEQKKDQQRVIFCRKNSRNLEKLVEATRFMKDRVIIDDEADFATPNAKINKKEITAINSLVGKLGRLDQSESGIYIGVTATPARLDLNNTYLNDSKKWVFLESHKDYKGRKFFFPATNEERQKSDYQLVKLPDTSDDPKFLRHAIFRFMLRVALLNSQKGSDSTAYSMLIHTAGKVNDHEQDEKETQKILSVLKQKDKEDKKYRQYINEMLSTAEDLVRAHRRDVTPNELIVFVLKNVGRSEVLVINHKSDSSNVKRAGDPKSLFTFAIGGNIVSRGLTFERLLTFFFSRTVKGRLQQNTYIQRARMFGNRPYSEYFELCVPETLFQDWATVFHDHEISLRLAKAGAYQHIQTGKNSVIDSGALDKDNVTMEKSERAVGEVFELGSHLEKEIINHDRTKPLTFLENLADRNLIDDSQLPSTLFSYLREICKEDESDMLIVLRDSNTDPKLQNIEQYKDGSPETITRKRGGIVHAMLNKRPEYSSHSHFILPIKNNNGQARFLYKSNIGQAILQNMRATSVNR